MLFLSSSVDGGAPLSLSVPAVPKDKPKETKAASKVRSGYGSLSFRSTSA
jgi:hypothetical protein